MKKYLLFLSAMAIFAGCANQDLTNVTEQSKTAVITAEKTPFSDGGVLGDGTLFRTAIDLNVNDITTNKIYWNAHDIIGLITLATNGFNGEVISSNNYSFEYAGTGGIGSDPVSGGPFQKSPTGNNAKLNSGDYVAYYPYRDVYYDDLQQNLIINLQSQIDGGSGTFSNFGSDDIMYGTNVINLDATTADAFNNKSWNKGGLPPSAQIIFKHATTMLAFKLNGIPASETVYQIIVKSVKYNQVLKRGFLLSPDSKMVANGYTPAIKLFTGGIDGGVRKAGAGASVASTGGEYDGIMAVTPGMAGEKFNIYLLTDQHYYNVGSFSAPSGGLKEGYIYSIARTLNPDNYLPKGQGASLEQWDGTSYSVPCVDMTDPTKPEITIRTSDELAWLTMVNNKQIPLYDWGGMGIDGIYQAASWDFNKCTIYIENDIDLGNHAWTPRAGFKGTIAKTDKMGRNLNSKIFLNGNPTTAW